MQRAQIHNEDTKSESMKEPDNKETIQWQPELSASTGLLSRPTSAVGSETEREGLWQKLSLVSFSLPPSSRGAFPAALSVCGEGLASS